MTAEKILSIARAELGEREFPPNSNKVKYNTAYYGRAVSGPQYAWCAAFVWWCFRQAGASALYYGGGKTAYCPTLLSWHRKQGQAVQGDYRPGDIIFFNFAGKKNAAHVGICESWDGAYITTIDGNTGSGNDANGGAVMRRRRAKKCIVGAYRPRYEEDETVTYEQWKEYMERYRLELAQCQRQFEIVRKRRRNFVVFRRGGNKNQLLPCWKSVFTICCFWRINSLRSFRR